ncbi:MAG: glutathione synthase, partial [Deltaproteobacteria bacterium]|nr:glutathione synthase [Deltaproteobacteria bacterium]
DTVFLICSEEQLRGAVNQARMHEKSGQAGFLIQQYVPTNRSLRLVLVGEKVFSYWRLQEDCHRFGTSVLKGARIDPDVDPKIGAGAEAYLLDFCRKTGINLAAFDVLFTADRQKSPLFLEINYYFGRRGLGGSEKFYRILLTEITGWLNGLGLSVKN